MAELIKSSDVETSQGSQSQPTNTPATPSRTANPPTPTQTGLATRANKPKGSGFTNINKVVQANQNNRLGQAVTGGIRQNVQTAQQGLNRAQSQFQEQSEQNRLGTGEQAAQRQQFLDRAAGGNVTGEDIANSQRFLSGQYTGPQGLENAETLAGNARSASQLAGQVGSAGGRQSLLQRFVGGGGPYTAGQQRLDNLLLGQTAGSDLQKVRREGQGLEQQAQAAEQAAGQTARQLGLQAEQFGRETGQLLSQQEGAVEEQIGQQLTAAQEAEAKRQEQYSNLRSQLGKVVNQEDASQLGSALQSAKEQGLIDEATFNDLNTKAQLLGGADKSDLVKKVAEAEKNERIFGSWADTLAKFPDAKNISGTPVWYDVLNSVAGQDKRVYNAIKDKGPVEGGKILKQIAQQRGQDAQLYKGLQQTSQADLAQQLLSGLSQTEAQNLSAQGLATDQQRAQANALAALRGNQAIFSQEGPAFTQGSTALTPEQFQQSQSNELLNQILGQSSVEANRNRPLTTLEFLKRQAGMT